MELGPTRMTAEQRAAMVAERELRTARRWWWARVTSATVAAATIDRDMIPHHPWWIAGLAGLAGGFAACAVVDGVRTTYPQRRHDDDE